MNQQQQNTTKTRPLLWKASQPEVSGTTVRKPVHPLLRRQGLLGNHGVLGRFRPGPIQAKLKIGAPDDRYEQEADRVADEVMRMPALSAEASAKEEGEGRRPRQCAECQDKELLQVKPIASTITPLVQRQAEEDEEDMIQPKREGGKTPQMNLSLSAQIRGLQGRGQPLTQVTRQFFEPRFGRDFSRVRVHTGERAAAMNRALHAQAFTTGDHIVFGRGKYRPGTAAGNRLLAHELVHVVQQVGAVRQVSSPRYNRLPIGKGPGRVLQLRRRRKRRGRKPPSNWRRVRGQKDIWEVQRLPTSLGDLAQVVSKDRKDWMCIKPVRMRGKAKPYYRHLSIGDQFDVSNLTLRTGPAVSGHEVQGDQALWAFNFYGASRFAHPPHQVMADTAKGNTPIRNMLIIGHTNNIRLGRLNLAAANPAQPHPTYARASAGEFPNRCLFTRNARVRAVGCSSQAFGNRFAGVFLRKGAAITTTSRAVCMSIVRNRAYILRNRRGKVVRKTALPDLYRACFSRHWGALCYQRPFRLSRFYHSPQTFHSGRYWKTIAGRS